MGSFKLHWPNPEEMKRARFDSIKHVPCVFSEAGLYHDEASWYLRERALLEWMPDDGQALVFPKSYPSRSSLRSYAYALVNFLNWLEAKGAHWKTVSFSRDLIQRYEAEMLSGRWSERGEPLGDVTINQRIDESVYFLRWAASRGLREPFRIHGRTKVFSNSDNSSDVIAVYSRAGRVRPAIRTLHLPTKKQVTEWLESVRVRSGETKALMCETVLETGLRREEVAQLRVSCLPPKEQVLGLDEDEQVKFCIRFGTKGPKVLDSEGNEHGPVRDIFVKASLARKLLSFLDRRSIFLSNFTRRARSAAGRKQRIRDHSDFLFISEYTGRPVKALGLYRAWVDAPHLPYAGWSPHPGRHYWACSKLLEEMKLLELGQPQVQLQNALAMESSAKTILELIIQPQLGHLSAATTRIYLQWLRLAWTQRALADQWQNELDGEQFDGR